MTEQKYGIPVDKPTNVFERKLDYVDRCIAYAKNTLTKPRPGTQVMAGLAEQMTCIRFLDDLERSKSPDFPFKLSRSRGNHICNFIEKETTFIKKTPKHAVGELYVMEEFQIFICVNLNGWIHKMTGVRRFAKALIEVPRGNAKSELAARIDVYYLVGIGVQQAHVYLYAPQYSQTAEVFRSIKTILMKNKPLRVKYGIRVMAEQIRVEKTETELLRMSGNSDGIEGQDPFLAGVDEPHLIKDRVLYDNIQTSMGKRQATGQLLMSITTAGFDKNSVGYELHCMAEKLLSREFIDETFFVYIACANERATPLDYFCPEALIEANPMWGISVDAEKRIADMREAIVNPRKRTNVLVKYLNRWQDGGDKFFDVAAIEAQADKNLKLSDFEGQECWIGVDLASHRDLCAVEYVFKKENKYTYFTRAFTNELAAKEASSKNANYAEWVKAGYIEVKGESVTDHEYITDELVKDCSRFKVKQIGFDKTNATLMMQKLSHLVDVVEVPQSLKAMSDPMKKLDELIRTGQFAYDGNPVFLWNMGNVVVNERDDGQIRPEKDNADAKIDVAVAAIIATSRFVSTLISKRKITKSYFETLMGLDNGKQ